MKVSVSGQAGCRMPESVVPVMPIGTCFLSNVSMQLLSGISGFGYKKQNCPTSFPARLHRAPIGKTARVAGEILA